AALAKPIMVGKLSVSIGISIGIAFYPKDGDTIETLFAAADAAMYASKASGKNRFSFADSSKLEGAASPLTFIAWNDQHDVGIRAFDAEHHKLATMIGMLGADLAAGEDVRRVRISFEKLIAYAQVHFGTEEALMDRHAVPDRVAHKQEHRKLLQDARSLAAN